MKSEELEYRKMVLTRDAAIPALTHVITAVMGEETAGAIATALNVLCPFALWISKTSPIHDVWRYEESASQQR